MIVRGGERLVTLMNLTLDVSFHSTPPPCTLANSTRLQWIDAPDDSCRGYK